MKEAVCKICNDICEWIEDDLVHCHTCDQGFNVNDVIVNEFK